MHIKHNTEEITQIVRACSVICQIYLINKDNESAGRFLNNSQSFSWPQSFACFYSTKSILTVSIKSHHRTRSQFKPFHNIHPIPFYPADW